MKSLWVLLLLSLVCPLWAATPTFVQSASEVNLMTYPDSDGFTTIKYNFPNKTQTGNCAFVWLQVGTGTTQSPTVTDDGGNTYTVIASQADTTNLNYGYLFAAPITSRSQYLTVSWAAIQVYSQSEAVEFANVTSCTSPEQTWSQNETTASTTITAGTSAKTTSTTGDLLLMFATQTDSTSNTSCSQGTQSNISWKLTPGMVQEWLGLCSQYGQYNSTAAINPTMSWLTSRAYIGIAVAIESGTSGTAGEAGMVPLGINHWNISGHTGNNTSSVPEQLVIAGNTMAVTGTASHGYDITGISSSPSLTWMKAVEIDGTSANGDAFIWYACNATPGTSYALTISMSTPGGTTQPEPDTALIAYDIQNGETSGCLDNAWSNSGTQTTSGTFAAISGMTPAQANEQFIVGLSVSTDTLNYPAATGTFAVADAGEALDASGNNDCTYSSPNLPDECNGFAHLRHTGTLAISSQWSSSTAVNSWVAAAAAFLPAPAAFTCTQHLTTSTFASAYSSAAGGDVLCLAPGTYTSGVGDIWPSSQVVVQADSSAGGTQTNVILSGGITMFNGSNVRFDTLTAAGVQLGDSSNDPTNIYLHNIHYTDSMCILVPTNSSLNITVDGGDFTNIGQSCTEGRLGINGLNVTHNVDPKIKITNVLFSGSGASGRNGSDGIQINGSPYAIEIGPNNYFTGILEDGCGTVHCDAIQFYGASGTNIHDNYFYNNSDGIMSPDCNGSPMYVTNNVFVQENGSATNEIILGGGNGDTFTHNAFSPINGAAIRIGNPNGCGLSTNVSVTNNVMPSNIDLTEGQTTSGLTLDYNLCNSPGCTQTGSHSITGNQVFVGGSSPTTYSGFALNSSSPGYNAASDGNSMGINP
jgi:hypothetical protein